MAGLGTGAPPIVQVYHEKSRILPDVSRVLACLYEKDIKFETHTASYKSLLKLQASTHAPVPFYDGPTFLEESREICHFIAEKYERHGYSFLLGKDALERASVEQWLHNEEHAFNPPSRALFCHLAFPPDKDDNGADIDMHTRKLEEVLEVYEQRLNDSEFLAGNMFTLADLVHLPNSHYITASDKFVYLYDSRKNVRRWWDAISARKSWQQVLMDMKRVEEQNKQEELKEQQQKNHPRTPGYPLQIYPRKQTTTEPRTISMHPDGTVLSFPIVPQTEKPLPIDIPDEPLVSSSQSNEIPFQEKPPQKSPISDQSTIAPATSLATSEKPPIVGAARFSTKDASSPEPTKTDTAASKLHTTDHHKLQVKQWHAVTTVPSNQKEHLRSLQQVKSSKDIQQHPSQDSEQATSRPVLQESMRMEPVEGQEKITNRPYTDERRDASSPLPQQSGGAQGIPVDDKASSDQSGAVLPPSTQKHTATPPSRKTTAKEAHSTSPSQAGYRGGQDTNMQLKDPGFIARKTTDQATSVESKGADSMISSGGSSHTFQSLPRQDLDAARHTTAPFEKRDPLTKDTTEQTKDNTSTPWQMADQDTEDTENTTEETKFPHSSSSLVQPSYFQRAKAPSEKQETQTTEGIVREKETTEDHHGATSPIHKRPASRTRYPIVKDASKQPRVAPSTPRHKAAQDDNDTSAESMTADEVASTEQPLNAWRAPISPQRQVEDMQIASSGVKDTFEETKTADSLPTSAKPMYTQRSILPPQGQAKVQHAQDKGRQSEARSTEPQKMVSRDTRDTHGERKTGTPEEQSSESLQAIPQPRPAAAEDARGAIGETIQFPNIFDTNKKSRGTFEETQDAGPTLPRARPLGAQDAPKSKTPTAEHQRKDVSKQLQSDAQDSFPQSKLSAAYQKGLDSLPSHEWDVKDLHATLSEEKPVASGQLSEMIKKSQSTTPKAHPIDSEGSIKLEKTPFVDQKKTLFAQDSQDQAQIIPTGGKGDDSTPEHEASDAPYNDEKLSATAPARAKSRNGFNTERSHKKDTTDDHKVVPPLRSKKPTFQVQPPSGPSQDAAPLGDLSSKLSTIEQWQHASTPLNDMTTRSGEQRVETPILPIQPETSDVPSTSPSFPEVATTDHAGIDDKFVKQSIIDERPREPKQMQAPVTDAHPASLKKDTTDDHKVVSPLRSKEPTFQVQPPSGPSQDAAPLEDLSSKLSTIEQWQRASAPLNDMATRSGEQRVKTPILPIEPETSGVQSTSPSIAEAATTDHAGIDDKFAKQSIIDEIPGEPKQMQAPVTDAHPASPTMRKTPDGAETGDLELIGSSEGKILDALKETPPGPDTKREDSHDASGDQLVTGPFHEQAQPPAPTHEAKEPIGGRRTSKEPELHSSSQSEVAPAEPKSTLSDKKPARDVQPLSPVEPVNIDTNDYAADDTSTPQMLFRQQNRPSAPIIRGEPALDSQSVIRKIQEVTPDYRRTEDLGRPPVPSKEDQISHASQAIPRQEDMEHSPSTRYSPKSDVQPHSAQVPEVTRVESSEKQGSHVGSYFGPNELGATTPFQAKSRNDFNAEESHKKDTTDDHKVVSPLRSKEPTFQVQPPSGPSQDVASLEDLSSKLSTIEQWQRASAPLNDMAARSGEQRVETPILPIEPETSGVQSTPPSITEAATTDHAGIDDKFAKQSIIDEIPGEPKQMQASVTDAHPASPTKRETPDGAETGDLELIGSSEGKILDALKATPLGPDTRHEDSHDAVMDEKTTTYDASGDQLVTGPLHEQAQPPAPTHQAMEPIGGRRTSKEPQLHGSSQAKVAPAEHKSTLSGQDSLRSTQPPSSPEQRNGGIGDSAPSTQWISYTKPKKGDVVASASDQAKDSETTLRGQDILPPVRSVSPSSDIHRPSGKVHEEIPAKDLGEAKPIVQASAPDTQDETARDEASAPGSQDETARDEANPYEKKFAPPGNEVVPEPTSSTEPRNEDIRDSAPSTLLIPSTETMKENATIATPDQGKDLQATLDQQDISSMPSKKAREDAPADDLGEATSKSSALVQEGRSSTVVPKPAPVTQYGAVRDEPLDKQKSVPSGQDPDHSTLLRNEKIGDSSPSTQVSSTRPRNGYANASTPNQAKDTQIIPDRQDILPPIILESPSSDSQRPSEPPLSTKPGNKGIRDSAPSTQLISSTDTRKEDAIIAAPNQDKDLQTTLDQQDIPFAPVSSASPSSDTQHSSERAREDTPADDLGEAASKSLAPVQEVRSPTAVPASAPGTLHGTAPDESETARDEQKKSGQDSARSVQPSFPSEQTKENTVVTTPNQTEDLQTIIHQQNITPSTDTAKTPLPSTKDVSRKIQKKTSDDIDTDELIPGEERVSLGQREGHATKPYRTTVDEKETTSLSSKAYSSESGSDLTQARTDVHPSIGEGPTEASFPEHGAQTQPPIATQDISLDAASKAKSSGQETKTPIASASETQPGSTQLKDEAAPVEPNFPVSDQESAHASKPPSTAGPRKRPSKDEVMAPVTSSAAYSDAPKSEPGTTTVQPPQEASFDLLGGEKTTTTQGDQVNTLLNGDLSTSQPVKPSASTDFKGTNSEQKLEGATIYEKSKAQHQTEQSDIPSSKDNNKEANVAIRSDLLTTYKELQKQSTWPKESMKLSGESEHEEQADQAIVQSPDDNIKQNEQIKTHDTETGEPEEREPQENTNRPNNKVSRVEALDSSGKQASGVQLRGEITKDASDSTDDAQDDIQTRSNSEDSLRSSEESKMQQQSQSKIQGGETEAALPDIVQQNGRGLPENSYQNNSSQTQAETSDKSAEKFSPGIPNKNKSSSGLDGPTDSTKSGNTEDKSG